MFRHCPKVVNNTEHGGIANAHIFGFYWPSSTASAVHYMLYGLGVLKFEYLSPEINWLAFVYNRAN